MQSHLTTASDGAYTLIDGRTEPGVTAVTLVLDNGQDVVATVADGWFVAWWPGSGNVTSAQVTTTAGTTTQPLLPAPLPGGPRPDSSGAPSNSGNSGSAGETSGSSGNSGSGPATFSNP